METRSNAGPAVESVQNDNRSTNGDHSRPACYAGDSAAKSTSTPHLPAASKRATNKVTSGGDGGSAGVYRVTDGGPPDSDHGTDKEAGRQSDDGGGLGVARKFLAQQKRCAVREGEVSRTFPPLPPGVEVLEVSCSVLLLLVHFH